eukprot:scaffold16743_cov129-Isochrysis_galbana.AAC.4
MSSRICACIAAVSNAAAPSSDDPGHTRDGRGCGKAGRTAPSAVPKDPGAGDPTRLREGTSSPPSRSAASLLGARTHSAGPSAPPARVTGELPPSSEGRRKERRGALPGRRPAGWVGSAADAGARGPDAPRDDDERGESLMLADSSPLAIGEPPGKNVGLAAARESTSAAASRSGGSHGEATVAARGAGCVSSFLKTTSATVVARSAGGLARRTAAAARRSPAATNETPSEGSVSTRSWESRSASNEIRMRAAPDPSPSPGRVPFGQGEKSPRGAMSATTALGSSGVAAIHAGGGAP